MARIFLWDFFMSYKYQIDSENRIAYLNPEGFITKDVVLQVIKDLVSDPVWEKDFDILKDFTRVDQFDLSYDDINLIVNEQVDLAEKNLFASKLAIVAPIDSLYGTSRMWQALAESNKFTIGVFRTKEEASNWLKEIK
jgi:hypothetical protein